MDSRRQYELAFQLSAQVNGSYNSTFKNAQSALASMQKEISGLNRTQSDISAYQKQQGAVEATNKKLEMLKQQYDNIQKEIAETGEFSSDLENKLLSKQQQIERTSGSLGQQTDKLNQMDAALREAGVDTGNLEKESQRLETEMQGLKRQQEEAADSAQSFGEKGAQAAETISTAIAAAGIAAALKEIAEAYMECIHVAGDFEETMSTVEALSGANASEIEELSSMAKQLGAATQYTAQESAEAMTYMAMASWDTMDMLNGMDGVLQLAAASGEDLASVSDIVTDALTAFGLSASDTAHFADILATTATGANTSVGLMGETFKYAAPLAGALGYSVEDVATMIGLMANSGIKSTQAGTALRTMFSKLTDGATLTAAAFGEIEVETQNADGSMRGLNEIISELRLRFGEMTEAEKIYNAEQLVGKNAMSGFVTLMNAADGDFEKLSASINDCAGAASKMSKIKMDNMNGELKLAQSAWEGVTIAVGEEFTPVMREVYKIAADVFAKMKEFIEKHPALVKAVTTFTAVIGTVVAAMTAYAAIVKVIKLLDVATLFTGPTGMILGAVAAVAGLTAGVVALISSVNEGVPSVRELTAAAEEMNEAMEQAENDFEETSANMAATASVAGIYITRLEELEAELGENASESQEYHNILELLTRTIPELAESIDLEKNAIEGGTEALRKQTEEWERNAEAQARQEYVNSLYDEYSEVMSEAAENEIKLTQAKMKERRAAEEQEKAQQRMNELWNEAQEKAQQLYEETGTFTDACDLLTGEYYEMSAAVTEYDNEIMRAQKEQKNLQKAIEEDTEAVNEAKAVIEDAESAIEEMAAADREAAEAAEREAKQEEKVSEAVGGIVQRAQELTAAYNKTYEAALQSISGQYDLWDKAAKVTEKSASDINKAMQSQTSYWKDYNTNLQSLSERFDEVKGLRDVIASFADGSQESVNAIAGMANASNEELWAMVENWKELQAQQEAASGSVSDIKENFTQEMDKLGQELAADIENMNLGEEAAEAGRATIQAFIDSAKGMESQVKAAYAGIATAANAALKGAGSTGTGTGGSGSTGIGHYAKGTVSAEPGFAEVGENGPEIVFLNGGEKILTAAETAKAKQELSLSNFAIQQENTKVKGNDALQNTQNVIEAVQASPVGNNGKSSQVIINSNPNFVINGNVPDDLEEKLEKYNQLLIQMVEDILNGNGDDRRTRFE